MIIPIRLMALVLAALYLIVPIPFAVDTREVLGIGPAATSDLVLSAIYGISIFLVFLLLPKEIRIKSSRQTFSWGIWGFLEILAIFSISIVFGIIIARQQQYGFSDKVLAHFRYEALNADFHLRLIYNICLCVFLSSVVVRGFRWQQVIFFAAPIGLEVIFSKNNYITHFLVFMFLWLWNSKVNRRFVIFLASISVVSLLIVRFLQFASWQSDWMKTIAAMFGEFTISWQSIPVAIEYSRAMIFNAPVGGWYSDVISTFAGLKIGLAGNPAAEMVYYFGDFAILPIMVTAVSFVLLARFAKSNFILSMAFFVIAFYLRDIMRTGLLMGFSIIIKTSIIFMTLKFVLSGIKRARPVSESSSPMGASDVRNSV